MPQNMNGRYYLHQTKKKDCNKFATRMRFGKFKAMQREQFTTNTTAALWWGTRHFTLTNELIKIINNVIIKFGGFAEIFMDAQTNVNGVTFSVCSEFQSSLLRRLGAVLDTGVEVDMVDADWLLNSLPRWPYVSFEFRTFGFGSFFFVVEGIHLRRRKRLTAINKTKKKMKPAEKSFGA